MLILRVGCAVLEKISRVLWFFCGDPLTIRPLSISFYQFPYILCNFRSVFFIWNSAYSSVTMFLCVLRSMDTRATSLELANEYMKDHIFELQRKICTGITEVMGSNPVQALISQLLKYVCNCDDQS